MSMLRFFNNSGPVNGKDHFCIAPISRIDTKKIWQLVLQKKYFLIRGPKQSGKTSYLLSLSQVINQNGQLKCLYFNVESLRGILENLEESIKSILFEIASRARDTFGDDYLEDMVTVILAKRGPYHALNELLTQWSKKSEKPIVLLVDEIDTLKGNVLTSVLSQIRAGYDKRPAFFPQSIIFCGTHDVIEKQFNIKDTTINLAYLRRGEMDELLNSYAEANKLSLDKQAMEAVWRLSNGQPWIISTLACELFYEMVPYKNMKVIRDTDILEAAGNIIDKKGNHLEYLIERLVDERVRKCVLPMLMGESVAENLQEDEVEFVRELGIIKETNPLEIANDLYKELIPRVLFNPVLYLINLDQEDFLSPDGKIDAVKLLKTFQHFFMNHAERLVKLIDYGNAGYVLVFQALLQKLTEWNAAVTRSYGLNKNCVILEITSNFPVEQRIVFFIKHCSVRASEQYRPILQSLLDDHDASYPRSMSGSDEIKAEFHLVAMNVNGACPWEERLFYLRKDRGGRAIHLWGF